MVIITFAKAGDPAVFIPLSAFTGSYKARSCLVYANVEEHFEWTASTKRLPLSVHAMQSFLVFFVSGKKKIQYVEFDVDQMRLKTTRNN